MEAKKDPASLEYTMDHIKMFSYEEKYNELCESHPLLMHILVASMTNKKVDSMLVGIILQ